MIIRRSHQIKYYYDHHHHRRRNHHHHHHPLFLFHSSFAGSQANTGLTDQALPIHCFAKTFPTIQHVLSTAASSVRIYRVRRRLSSFKLPCNLFGITPAVGSTCGTKEAVFSSSFKSVYCWSFSVVLL